MLFDGVIQFFGWDEKPSGVRNYWITLIFMFIVFSIFIRMFIVPFMYELMCIFIVLLFGP